ncbi:MAG: hypothetical protein KatS3mg015_1583 [Fimbriimonadales bacterium]|nr:MAG: hypothetical protein KatS3mg015_1583 [Fimbriimonadales bacterium]
MWQHDDFPTWDLTEDSLSKPECEGMDRPTRAQAEEFHSPALPVGHHVIVFSLDPPGFCSGRLSGETERSLSVTLDHEPDRLVLWPLSVCVVAYLHEGETNAFLARVWGFGVEAGVRRRPVLVLSKPSRHMALDWRSAPRVTVPEEAGIEANLLTGASGKWPCKVRNLSVSGALLEFDPSRLPELPTGSEAELDLVWDGGHARLLAVVCRRSAPTLAVMFPESVCGDEIRPPMQLETLVKELQTLWLMRKAA